MKPRLQTICPSCGHEIWIHPAEPDYRICIECGASLPQQSSEDADEGTFTTTKEGDQS